MAVSDKPPPKARSRTASSEAAAKVDLRPPSTKSQVDAKVLDEIGLPEMPDEQFDPLAAAGRTSSPPVESQVRPSRPSRPTARPQRPRAEAAPEPRPRSSRVRRTIPPDADVRIPGQRVGGTTRKVEDVEDRFSRPIDVLGNVNLPVIGKFGPYDILGRLAMGGMAEILLARKTGDDTIVVLKKILSHFARDEDFVEMFLDEARIGSALDHDNICRFLDWGGVDEEKLYIAMEWVNGVTLGRAIRRGRKHQGIPIALGCEMIAKVADALHYAHTARNEEGQIMGLVHRDVSPHNIMLGYDGAVKLLDFGIAKAQVQSHHTQVGVVKGKFAYMAPEQCRGKAIDFRIDIFALGVVLFETLTGKSLYRRDSEAETMRAIVEGPIPSLHDRLDSPPRELEAIVQTALAKNPQHRFPTAAAMRDVLRMYVKRSRQPVGQDRVAAMVQHFFAKDLRRGPSVDSTPFGTSYTIEQPRPTMQPPKREERPPPEGLPEVEAPRTIAQASPMGAAVDEVEIEIDADAEVDAEVDAAPTQASAQGDAGFDLDDMLPVPDMAPPEPAEVEAVKPVEGLEGILMSAPDLAPEPSADDGEDAPAPAPRPVLPGRRSAPARTSQPSRPSRPSPVVEPKGTGMWLKAVVVLLLLTTVGAVGFVLTKEEPETAPMGTVIIRSQPPGARVLFEERPAQATPLSFEGIAPGSYEVVLQSPGHRTVREVIQVGTERGVILDVEMPPL